MSFKLPELPFKEGDLSPIISSETVQYHYGKHQKSYVEKLNSLIEGTEYESKSLEEIIKKAEGPIFNNAAQAYNHDFYWRCLTPKGSKKPSGKISELIDKEFGSFDEFKTKFSDKAKNLFGSGWVWLVKKQDGSLGIEPGSNAYTPIVDGYKPLLTCDVWEHAYYIDYRNEKPKYVDKFWDLINWNFVNEQL